MPNKSIRIIFTLVLSLMATLAMADTWPSKPIKFIVPFGPGGANDLVARAAAEAMAKQLGRPIIVENKPGAGATLGAEFVAHSAPDGYTFLTPAGGVITTPMIKAKVPYQESDLIPVALLALSPSIIVVPSNSPIKNFKELLSAAKTGNGINFSTAGTGSTPHFVAEMLKLHSGGKFNIIPYKSGSEGMVAVIGGQVDATSESSVVVMQQIKAGKLRPIASTWNRRIAALPDVATTKELGAANVMIGHWSGIFAPKGTPAAILEKMNHAADEAMKSAAVRGRLVPQGIEPIGGSRADFVKYLTAEKARLAPVVKASKMKED